MRLYALHVHVEYIRMQLTAQWNRMIVWMTYLYVLVAGVIINHDLVMSF